MSLYEEAREIREIASYDKDTGIFIRVVKCKGCNVGDIMGSKDKDGYLRIVIGGNPRYAHRLAWFYLYGELPNAIDHINGCKDDNRMSNLRSVTYQENAKNRPRGVNNKSGFIGVSWFEKTNKWRVTINYNKKQIHIGYFLELYDAVTARGAASIKYGYHKNHGR